MFFKVVLSLFVSSYAMAQQFPYEFSVKLDTPILVGSGVLALSSHFVLENASTPSEDDINALNKKNVNSFDRPYAGHYDSKTQENSNVFLYVSIPSFTLGSSLLIDYRRTLKLMSLAAESLIVAGALTQTAKASIKRFRPRAYPESDLGLPSKMRKDQKNSFFSGHASAISASCGFAAKIFSDYFPRSSYRGLVWASMLSVGAVGSWMRVEAGAHFPSDAVMGFALGFLSSWGVLELHKNTELTVVVGSRSETLGIQYSTEF